METIGSFEAKTHWSALLDKVSLGQEIVITKRGKPIARLIPELMDNKEHIKNAAKRLKSLRKGITRAEISIRLNELSILPIKTDLETHRQAFIDIASLAQTHNLTAYDAAYLELALRRDLPLATKDKALKKAAQNLQISVL